MSFSMYQSGQFEFNFNDIKTDINMCLQINRIFRNRDDVSF